MSLDLSYESLKRASQRAAELFTEIYCQLEAQTRRSGSNTRGDEPDICKFDWRQRDRTRTGIGRFFAKGSALLDGHAASTLFWTGQFVTTASWAAQPICWFLL